MTHFDAATAWTAMRRAGVSLCLLTAALGLAGCETANNILGGGQIATEAVAPQPAAEPAKPQMAARIALAPIIGAPDALGLQLRTQVVQASERHQIGILADREAGADFGMRGYVVAARDKAGVKVSYIWDVTDTSGKRVNRITGEETVPAAPAAKDPWGSVTPTTTRAIADKVAASLGAWVPNQPKGAPVAAAPAQPTYSGAVASGAGAGALADGPPSANPSVASGPVTNTVTSALPGSAGPVVTGAPGDGNSALASALSRELSRQSMPLDGQSKPYRVEGQVTVGATKDGKQPIQIDWRVKDGKGTAVGTVTQKNAIPPGSLDSAWGQTADAAAAAAAQGIIKLLPQQAAAKATN